MGDSDNRGDQGRTDSEIGEEHRFGDDRGSMEFGWRRGSVREEQNQNKGITKGGNDKIRMVQGKIRGIGKGSEGKTRMGLNTQGLIVKPSEGQCGLRITNLGMHLPKFVSICRR